MPGLENISDKILIELYTLMLEIRKVELEIDSQYSKDEMKTPIHSCIGQEAIAAGVCMNLSKDDYVFSNHRGHGHYIGKKGDLKAMIAELYNRETGCSKGRGGSMHLIDTSAGLLGSSSIVGGNIPIATGAALAAKMKNNNKVSVVFFGDGAAEEGVLYESINFAVIKKLPIIYVCENNLYSVCSPLDQRQPSKDIYKKAAGFSIPSYKIDGNDVLNVYELSKEVISRAKLGEGPAFIECETYRLKDHHGTKTGIELGYRTIEEVNYWTLKCPIKKLEKLLLKKEILTDEILISINNIIDKKIEDAFIYAKNSPLPQKKDILRDIYC